MDCFYHSGRRAIGLCRSCFRGLCGECATDLDRALACRNRCEEHAQALIRTLDLSSQQRGTVAARRLLSGLSVISLLVGVFVAVLGLRLPMYREIALLGIPFLLIGLLTGNLGRALPQKTKNGANLPENTRI
jgi:Flp pilus assembly protein TadB